MGSEVSRQGCAAGLFSKTEWRDWRRDKGQGAAVGVRCRYHVNQQLQTRYELTDTNLGSGFNGSVRLARGRAGTSIEKREFAVKTVLKSGETEEGRRFDPALVNNEVMIMLSLDHPNIAKLEDVFDMPSHIDMVMERLGETLLERISERKQYAEDVAVEAVRQMCQAVAYLHSLAPPVVHRDLKPENFVYECKESSRLKLIDFGFSTKWDKRLSPSLEGRPGTESYMAPEVLERKSPTEKCDLFSLGVIAYILVTGHHPFHKNALQMYKVNHYDPFSDETFQNISSDGRSFIKSLLSLEAEQRPGAKQCLELPWLQRRDGAPGQGVVLDEAVLKSIRSFSCAERFKRTCLSMVAWSLTAEDREYLRSCFMEMDQNGNGRISLNDMHMALENNFKINNAEADDIFKKLDDGSEISYTGFIAMAMQERVRTHEGFLKAAFSRLDHNGKGFISFNDLRSMLGEDLKQDEIEACFQELGKTCLDRISCKDFMEFLSPCGDQLEVATRIIDGEWRRARQTQGSRRPTTLPATSTRQPDMLQTLQRSGKDERHVKCI